MFAYQRSFVTQGTMCQAFGLTVRDIASGTMAPDLNLTMAGYSSSRCAPLTRGVSALLPSLCPPDAAAPSLVFATGENSKDDHDFPHLKRGITGIVAREVTLGGWLIADPSRNDSIGGNCATGKSEDWHFDIYPDPDFIRRNYPSPDLLPLAGAIIPGQPEHQVCALTPGCLKKIPLMNAAPNVSTFLMPGNGSAIDVELNAWHSDQPPSGRGWPPSQYVADPETNLTNCNSQPYSFNAWAFDPTKKFVLPGQVVPDSSSLKKDNYVIVTGSLWEDIGHESADSADPCDPLTPFHACFDNIFSGHGGWLEIHPVDVVRYVSPEPALRKHPSPLATCASHNSPNRLTYNWTGRIEDDPLVRSCSHPPVRYQDIATLPEQSQPVPPNLLLRYQVVNDSRFSTGNYQTAHSQNPDIPYDPCRTSLTATEGLMNSNGDPVADSTIILTWWELSSTPRPPCPILPSIASIVTQEKPLTIRAVVTDKYTQKPVPNATVWINDVYGRQQAQGVTAADGSVSLQYKDCGITGASAYGSTVFYPRSCKGVVAGPNSKPTVMQVSFWTPALTAEGKSDGVKHNDQRRGTGDERCSAWSHSDLYRCCRKEVGIQYTTAGGTATLSAHNCMDSSWVSGTRQTTIKIDKSGYVGCSLNTPQSFGSAKCP